MYRVYQVGNNDTIDDIAKIFNTSIEKLKELNGIKGNVILQPGGFLIVPVKEDNEYYDKYIVKKGDTIYSIAKDYNADYKTIIDLNGLEKEEYIYPGLELIIPKNGVEVYKTIKGDSIDSVIEKTGVELNNLITPTGEIYLEEDQIIMYK